MKVYDCFLYNGEKECLDIAVDELKELNPVHILVEGFFTFTGIKREIKYQWGEYNNVYPVPCFVMPNNGNAWDNEKCQRNHILKVLKIENPNDDDIIIIRDADEIPALEAVKKYKPEMGLTALRMDIYWYKLNCLAERQTWVSPRIMTWKYLKETTPEEVRRSGYESVIDKGGCHFSYLGDENFIASKLKNFSHQEYNTPEFTNADYIKHCIATGKSLWGNSNFEFVEINDTFPGYVRNNHDKLSHLIHKT